MAAMISQILPELLMVMTNSAGIIVYANDMLGGLSKLYRPEKLVLGGLKVFGIY